MGSGTVVHGGFGSVNWIIFDIFGIFGRCGQFWCSWRKLEFGAFWLNFCNDEAAAGFLPSIHHGKLSLSVVLSSPLSLFLKILSNFFCQL